MNIKRLINISRPRFWIYVLGTYMVGVIAAGDPRIYNAETGIILMVLFLFFSFSANLLIYGINDIYDYETDKYNPKKIEYEELVAPQDRLSLYKAILISLTPFLLIFFWLNIYASIAFCIFIFVSVFYSAKPIRAKVNPPFDIIFSSVIYISPALIGFFATGNTNISWLGVLGGLLWAMAMQTYSAVPDIQADRKGNIRTLATVLGKSRALRFCILCYALATIIGYVVLGVIPLILGSIYLGMVAFSIKRPNKLFWMYKKFPLVNAVFGMILFFLLLADFLI